MITGTAIKMGDNIDTDIIIPTFALQKSRDPKTFADYAFYHTIPGFSTLPDKIIVAGLNFGCGSSREEAVFALIHSRVQAVVAQSFAPIFKRNAFNNALLCVEVDTTPISDHDAITIDITKKIVYNKSQSEQYEFTLSKAEETLIKEGGLLNILRKRLTTD
jgi:3-isopropylmalate/(R)-2-methylmalate dehydratase small subunit